MTISKKKIDLVRKLHKGHVAMMDELILILPSISKKTTYEGVFDILKKCDTKAGGKNKFGSYGCVFRNYIKKERFDKQGFYIQTCNECRFCMFDVCGYISSLEKSKNDVSDYMVCMRGLLDKLCTNMEYGNKDSDKTIEIANKIRIFPLKPEYEYEGCYDN